MQRLTDIAKRSGLIAILAGGIALGAIFGYSAATMRPTTNAPVGGVIITVHCPEEDSLEHHANECTILDVTPNR